MKSTTKENLKGLQGSLTSLIEDLWSSASFKAIIFMVVILPIWIYFVSKDNVMYHNVLAGLWTGFVVTAFHVFVDYQNLQLHKIVHHSKLKNMLGNRDSKEYYRELLEESKKKIYIMGSSCSRFLTDFSGTEDNTRILNQLLEQGVQVKLLITDLETMLHRSESQFKNCYSNDNFEAKHFNKESCNFIPQSIFIVDDQCILGPMFTGVDSKETVALHFSEISKYAEQYEQYFDTIWDEATPVTLGNNDASSAN